MTIDSFDLPIDLRGPVALITGIGGAALLGVGVYLHVSDGSSAPEKASGSAFRRVPPPKPTLRASPSIGSSSGGLVLSGTF